MFDYAWVIIVLTLASNRAKCWQAYQLSMIKTDLSELKAALKPGQRLMGLDLGEKTIGLALSDTLLTVASPFQTLKRSKFAADAAVLGVFIAEHGVGGLILGLPLNMDGSEGPSAQSARAFARNFAKVSDCPLAFMDERLSTAAVMRTLLEVDASRRRRSQLVDKMAAAYILQAALDRLRHLPQPP
jgi:putative Holliday junction resolvase